QAEDGIRDRNVTGVQTCALPISTSQCEGIGVVIPGVVDSETGRVLNAPVDTEKPVRTENTGFGSVREIIIVSTMTSFFIALLARSEERRVGKECSSWRSTFYYII